MMTASVSMVQEFSSLDELNSPLKLREEHACVTISLRTIAATHKHDPKCHINDDLGYSELNYACIHGGRQYVSQSKGKRKFQRYDKGQML